MSCRDSCAKGKHENHVEVIPYFPMLVLLAVLRHVAILNFVIL